MNTCTLVNYPTECKYQGKIVRKKPIICKCKYSWITSGCRFFEQIEDAPQNIKEYSALRTTGKIQKPR